MSAQIIRFPTVVLNWSPWHEWPALGRGARDPGGVAIPGRAGVYEVTRDGSGERLTIGRASNLRRRIRRGLVQGSGKHSTGKRIRAAESVSALVVRWAETNRPAAVEEELHLRHIDKYGGLPRYTKNT
jgi:hypothetical protein